jgi:hypothetical protein
MTSTFAPRTQPAARRVTPLHLIGWLLVALLWLALIVVSYQVTLNHPLGAADYFAYYKGARAITTGQPLYTGIGGETPYLYPPLLAMLLAPIAALADFKTSAVIWLLLNIAITLVTLAALSHAIRQPSYQMALWVGAALFTPLAQTLWMGQVSLVLFALAAGTWLAYREDKPLLAGALLALAVWIKVYPAIILLYFIWRRDWRVIASTVVSGTILGVIQLIAVGPAECLKLITVVLPDLSNSGSVALSNQSIQGFAYRLFTPLGTSIPLTDNATLIPITRLIMSLVLVVVSLWVIAKKRGPGNVAAQFDFEYALVSLLALLLGTVHGAHATMPVFLVIFLLLRNAPRRTRPSTLGLCFIAALLINLNPGLALAFLYPDTAISFSALVWSTPFFAMILLWGMLLIADFRAANASG